MSEVEQQLHGYRQGHQLLSSTIRLPKSDQDLIDRLSDVAGPLGPGERFAPYLTLYPLPSAKHYVIARTWQDFDAPRAGCVRTRSILVPMSEWVETQDVAGLIEIATRAGADRPAERGQYLSYAAELPQLEPGQGVELVEALFLEERVPIVVFDAENPEPLAIRLTTALWSGFRRTFSMSTFARSPRTIERRSFDLVFAPREARSRYSAWNGRRIDGRKKGKPRHPWSETIIARVLNAPWPSLEDLDALGEMASDTVSSESVLRISLLWIDLRNKLPTVPTAALGMLDIVNSRNVQEPRALRDLELALETSASLAVQTMPADDAWMYLTALIQKLRALLDDLPVAKAIWTAAYDLTVLHPDETLSILSRLDIAPKKALVTSAVADGLDKALTRKVADRLSHLDGSHMLDLLLASTKLAHNGVANFPGLAPAVAAALYSSGAEVRAEAKQKLLPLFVDESYAEAAQVLIGELDVEGIVKAARNAHSANDLASPTIRSALAGQARRLRAEIILRDAAIAMGVSKGSYALIGATLERSKADLVWILSSVGLDDEGRVSLMRSLLDGASAQDLRNMLTDAKTLEDVIFLLDANHQRDVTVLCSIANNVQMPDDAYITLTLKIVGANSALGGSAIVHKAIELALLKEPYAISVKVLENLVAAVGSSLHGPTVMRLAVSRDLSSEAVSRNLVALASSPKAVRHAAISGIEDMARGITSRSLLDLTIEGSIAAASLLDEAESVIPSGHLRASATMLPYVLAEPSEVASYLVASAFPPVYRALAKDGSSDLVSYIFIFLDWDKCKSARRRLAEAFVQSRWRIVDMASAAVKAGDPVRILGRIGREQGGKRRLEQLSAEIELVRSDFRAPVRAALDELGIG